MNDNHLFEAVQGAYTISTDQARLDIDRIYQFLSEEAYWSLDISREIVERGITNALCFGVYEGDRLCGFARVISDYATFAYVADVFILPEDRGRGLSKWLIQCVIAHPDLQNLRRWMLLTVDAHELYRQYGGFTSIANPTRHMERVNMTIYQDLKALRTAQSDSSAPGKP